MVTTKSQARYNGRFVACAMLGMMIGVVFAAIFSDKTCTQEATQEMYFGFCNTIFGILSVVFFVVGCSGFYGLWCNGHKWLYDKDYEKFPDE